MREQNEVRDLTQEQTDHADRRQSDRFPIEREVRYRVLSKRTGDDAGDGKTLKYRAPEFCLPLSTFCFPDGGWNCRSAGRRSSTINAL